MNSIERAVDELMSGEGGVLEQTPADQANVVRADTVFVASLSQVLAGVDFDRQAIQPVVWGEGERHLDMALVHRERFIEDVLPEIVGDEDYEEVSQLVQRRVGEDVYIDIDR